MKDMLGDLPVRYHAGKGLLAGIEVRTPEQAARVTEICQTKGLLVVDTGRKWVKLGPPLNIGIAAFETGIEILKGAINEALKEPEVMDDDT